MLRPHETVLGIQLQGNRAHFFLNLQNHNKDIDAYIHICKLTPINTTFTHYLYKYFLKTYRSDLKINKVTTNTLRSVSTK
jgi:hypothetical protein